ncbi:MAG: hypothetical protein A2096_15770 [Spirochaetes bacterium GWF1_41_5]|nr:MAG: hypothetical protein A2096_15770 [Spirochaetes bacterium GWF1_41_5]
MAFIKIFLLLSINVCIFSEIKPAMPDERKILSAFGFKDGFYFSWDPLLRGIPEKVIEKVREVEDPGTQRTTISKLEFFISTLYYKLPAGVEEKKVLEEELGVGKESFLKIGALILKRKRHAAHNTDSYDQALSAIAKEGKCTEKEITDYFNAAINNLISSYKLAFLDEANTKKIKDNLILFYQTGDGRTYLYEINELFKTLYDVANANSDTTWQAKSICNMVEQISGDGDFTLNWLSGNY